MEQALANPPYPRETLDTLFQHILLDDVPHPETPLPATTLPVCTSREIEEGYRLSWQLLVRGFDRRRFRRLVARIALTGQATARERQAFKDVRARCKHMRFACANFDRKHHYPLLLQGVTVLMGNMQDAFKHHDRLRTLSYGLTLWLMLGRGPFALFMQALLDFEPATPEDVKDYQQRENHKLQAVLDSQAHLTGHEFHTLRKFISRRVAFNDTLRTLRPDPALHQLSECLATLNGMMGEKHDELVEKSLHGTQNYRQDRFAPPAEIVSRLKEFLQASVDGKS
ncbi:hypothetical protein [Oecophyllibacter saccharovorans]|uniref:hypothetical protein n=1 Tax=Oecophyllibacter saccharovorans TaxID=2558360 RepID=UPI001168BB78|nr:hypothetical protein [Oecophyllibacter saccharovorans]TPW33719.1 hypothetical protein E3203_07905 [Oecophyllibacter saccharovorans]